jgi:hypothetical protein
MPKKTKGASATSNSAEETQGLWCSSFSFHRSGNAQQSRSSVDENKAILMWMWKYWMKLYWHGWISFISLLYRILFGADWSSVNYHGCSHCLLFSWICVFWRSAILLDENNVYYFFMVLLHMEFGQLPWMKFSTILKDFFFGWRSVILYGWNQCLYFNVFFLDEILSIWMKLLILFN